MIAIPSCNHVFCPVTELATMLPIIVADICCQDSGLLMQEATSNRGYIICQSLLRQVSWVRIVRQRATHCCIVLDELDV